MNTARDSTARDDTAPADVQADYPYRLRLEHEGMLSIRCERPGPWLRFDPRSAPADGELVVLTGAWPEQIQGTVEAFASGRRPQVVASEALVRHLAQGGAPESCLHRDHLQVDGVEIQIEPFTPIPWITSKEGVHKVKSGLLRPDRALRRLGQRARLPAWQPQVASVRLPDGGRLLHLGLSLHTDTPEAWLVDRVARWSGADWLLAGCDHGNDQAVAARIGRFGARHILMVDLLGELRRKLGMPVSLLTPLVDQMRGQGLDAYVFASKVSFRFE